MRILAFSDLHRQKDTARDIVQASSTADVVIGAGDFATRGLGTSDTLDILREMDTPIIMVAGNHDMMDELNSWGATSTFETCSIHNLGPTIHYFDI